MKMWKKEEKKGNAHNWWFLVFSRLLVRIVVNSKQCVINALSCNHQPLYISFISARERAFPPSKWTWSPFCLRQSWWSLPRCQSPASRSCGPLPGPGMRNKWRLDMFANISTEMRFILCTWLVEISSCSFLTVLPGPAWVLIIKFCQE